MKGGKREKNEEAVDAASVAYHVLHKLPSGDSPYVRAKHLQVCPDLDLYFTYLLSFSSIVYIYLN